MDFKLKYFMTRNKAHANNSSTRFTNYADREVKTFSILARLSKLSNNFEWKAKKILDLGAGDQFLKDQFTHLGAKYTPIDYDQADFNHDKLPYSKDTFDVIFSLAVIEHLHNIDNFLSETYRILKPGGILYLSTPNFRYCYKSFYDDPTHIRPYTETSISRTLTIFGFDKVIAFPGLRCKSDWFYTNKFKFFISAYIPFKKNKWFVPSILTGRATSVIAICCKPN